MNKLLIRNAKQIVKVCNNGEKCLKGPQLKQNFAVLEADTEGYSLVVGADGNISAIGTVSEVEQLTGAEAEYEQVIDATGKCILPGLIDGHTHPVWVGDRVHEFAMKLAGATYTEVHQAGGGINFTVNCVREAREDELYNAFTERLLKMSKCGTTTIEAKSGYGLDVDNEMKMLHVIERARKEFASVEISSTYCGAHSIPKGKTMEEATKDVIEVQIPKMKSLMDSSDLHVENIDVFCEKGFFDRDATFKILSAGAAAGLAINFHGDELTDMGSGELGASVHARAISHLEELSPEGIEAMRKADVVGVLLPTTAYILKLKPPPAREMLDAGVTVALGSDFNPNAHCMSMPLVMHLSCCLLRMSMPEALAGATINAAASIGRADTHGSLEEGKVADIVVLEAPRWEHLIYQLGGHDDVISHVIKRGSIVYCKS